jgi:hypothetical protein
MHEMQPRVLERVVEWLYSGEVGEISGVAEGLALLEGSRFLGVERMEAQCSAWVCAHVEASNCVAVWAEASRLGCGVVAERALLVVGRRLAAVAGEAEFLGLSREALLELVRSEGLAVRSERAVYEAVMGWVRHDVASRKAWLGEMLGAVRMGLLPLAYLVDTVAADPLVRESFEATRTVLDAGRWSRLRGVARVVAESDGRLRKRKHASGGGGGEFVVVGGETTTALRLKTAEAHPEVLKAAAHLLRKVLPQRRLREADDDRDLVLRASDSGELPHLLWVDIARLVLRHESPSFQ